jgi:hypothetical protein
MGRTDSLAVLSGMCSAAQEAFVREVVPAEQSLVFRHPPNSFTATGKASWAFFSHFRSIATR